MSVRIEGVKRKTLETYGTFVDLLCGDHGSEATSEDNDVGVLHLGWGSACKVGVDWVE